jgi:hypothetical protein
MAYTCKLLLRALPAIARDNQLEPQQKAALSILAIDPITADGSVIKGPAAIAVLSKPLNSARPPNPRTRASAPKAGNKSPGRPS